MMNTPICDFVKSYINSNSARMHMPGHKGIGFLGFEEFDITEINGADSLFEAESIIAESEKNASEIFGCNSFYSTEGSSLCIRAMVYLLKSWGKENTKIIAARNCHKAFLSAVALLDADVEWLEGTGNYLSNEIDLKDLESRLNANEGKSVGVYITSPDYLGNMANIKAISQICKSHNAKLLVDNAHGAYLKFLPVSKHPIDLGADMCCDSAHKTLPVLTGGAYLHIKDGLFAGKAKDAMNLFASSSPSYLILQSLDNINPYLQAEFKEKLNTFAKQITALKERLKNVGFSLVGEEELKIVIDSKKSGYYGIELAEFCEKHSIFCEFADKDYLVLMLSPENNTHDLERLLSLLEALPQRAPICEEMPKIPTPKRALTPRETVFKDSEIIPASKSLGRIFAGFNISCPPAVPIVMCGEIIDENAIKLFEYYEIKTVCVVK